MFILLNLKAYDADVEAVAQAATTVGKEVDARIVVAPQTAQLRTVSVLGGETWAQGIAGIEPGSHTGSSLAEAAVSAGASGTILNHSEQRLTLAALEDAITAANRTGLETLVCANTPEQCAAAAALGPDAIAVEPPALIGSGTPVSKANPDIVREAITAVNAVDSSLPLLCGAGISTGDDLQAAAELGAQGVLLASGVALADDPEAALRELVAPLQ